MEINDLFTQYGSPIPSRNKVSEVNASSIVAPEESENTVSREEVETVTPTRGVSYAGAVLGNTEDGLFLTES